jgi:hypothetical protein
MFLQTPHMLTADRLLQLIIRLEEKKEPAVDSVTAEPVDSADEWDDMEYINCDSDQSGEDAAAPEDDHAPAADLRISIYKKVSEYFILCLIHLSDCCVPGLRDSALMA